MKQYHRHELNRGRKDNHCFPKSFKLKQKSGVLRLE